MSIKENTLVVRADKAPSAVVVITAESDLGCLPAAGSAKAKAMTKAILANSAFKQLGFD